MEILWLVLLVVLLVVEIITMGLTTIWFAGGALISLIVSLLGGPVWLQVVLFAVVSLVMLIFTRPVAVKYINKKSVKTNAEGLIGKNAKVIYTIDNANSTGYAIVDGQEWTARSLNDDEVFKEGSIVTIVRIEGVKLIVKRKEEVA